MHKSSVGDKQNSENDGEAIELLGDEQIIDDAEDLIEVYDALPGNEGTSTTVGDNAQNSEDAEELIGTDDGLIGDEGTTVGDDAHNSEGIEVHN